MAYWNERHRPIDTLRNGAIGMAVVVSILAIARFVMFFVS